MKYMIYLVALFINIIFTLCLSIVYFFIALGTTLAHLANAHDVALTACENKREYFLTLKSWIPRKI